jgi:hypothetical protein
MRSPASVIAVLSRSVARNRLARGHAAEAGCIIRPPTIHGLRLVNYAELIATTAMTAAASDVTADRTRPTSRLG